MYFMMNIKKVKALVMVMCMVITGIGELNGKLIEWAVDGLKADTYLILKKTSVGLKHKNLVIL